ncbi:Acyl transferase/acyl hydrolase/lysophospholipase [Penicillium sp. CMV-2018d]|nr:Acyl transferase/acyl hydrolase/lysophospholipase [Penicillium sp. CMV-2018d]
MDPNTVRYVEAHAISTPLGDPTEISAIADVYGTDRPADDPCYIGSIKPNIGHLEAGAGVMGFIKAILTIQKGKTAGIKVVQEATRGPPQTRSVEQVYICIGTEALSLTQSSRGSILSCGQTSWTIGQRPDLASCYCPAPRRNAKTLSEWMTAKGKDHNLSEILTTLATRRDHHNCRAALVVDNHLNTTQGLQALANRVDHSFTT